MRTNYYAVLKQPKAHERMEHLDKASGGWRFLFQETSGIKSYPQVARWLGTNSTETRDYVWMNEYDEEATAKYLLELTQKMQGEDSPRNFSNGRDVDGCSSSNREFR
ncbi:MAG: hypothetical protein FWD58_09090 [Firmicutes bacterium]|nr:hypothetical protein [Bacillota bacterium]